MGFIDFAVLKERLTIEQVVSMLDLKLKSSNKQLRGACPSCKSGGERALVVTPERQAYYCFADQKGGDLIQLAAHIKDISVKDAAQFLSSTVPEATEAKQTSEKLQPLSYLEPEHEAVLAVGFDPEVAKALGIGYAKKGILRGTVAVPVRLPDGSLAGYIGITEAKLPPKFLV